MIHVTETQGHDSTKTGAINRGYSTHKKTDERLKAACQEFEAYFTAQMLKTMRDSGMPEGFMPKNSGERIFEAQRDTELAKELAHRGALGISEMLYADLSQHITDTETSEATLSKHWTGG